jgi:hypothetical protein
MSDLVALAHAAEGAEGPDRELDGAIHCALDPTRQRKMDEIGAFGPAYTASIDASLMLVPEGWDWELTTTGFKPGASMIGPKRAALGIGSYAATPALAIVAAALKARATMEDKTDER